MNVKITKGHGAFAVLAIIVGSIGGLWGHHLDVQPSCHDSYVHDYAFYGQPGALSEQDYCDTVNQTPVGGDYPQNRYADHRVGRYWDRGDAP